MNASIWIGFDTKQADSYFVCRESIKRRLTLPIPIHGLVLSDLIKENLYRRPMENRDGKMWDVLSHAPMSTEFANSRFLVPHLARRGWAVFMDSDMLVRVNLVRLLETLDKSKALYCVKHYHVPSNETKMDGQKQTSYPRKNWSSMMIFNCDHPANHKLTLDMVNTVPGRDLHRLCWLDDEEIGELDQSWNWLVGTSPKDIDPKIVHFTDGGPWMDGYENVPYADEWRAELNRMAA